MEVKVVVYVPVWFSRYEVIQGTVGQMNIEFLVHLSYLYTAI